MPFIHTRLNKTIEKEKELRIKEQIGNYISILGKSENWLMLDFTYDCNLYFQGTNDKDIAYVEVKLFGGANSSAYNEFTKELTNLLSTELGINPSNIYISYFETNNWGWNGNTF